jgi:hypothetical protein
LAEDLNIAGGMPPAFRNHLVRTGCDTPAATAASSLLSPAPIASQNCLRSLRPATGGRPGDSNGARPNRSDRRFRMLIATSSFRALRRPFESAHRGLGFKSPLKGSQSVLPKRSIRRRSCADPRLAPRSCAPAIHPGFRLPWPSICCGGRSTVSKQPL